MKYIEQNVQKNNFTSMSMHYYFFENLTSELEFENVIQSENDMWRLTFVYEVTVECPFIQQIIIKDQR